MARRRDDFQTIRSEGGLLPPDLLRRLLDPKGKLDGARPEDYSLPQDERLSDVITQSWSRLRKRWAEFRKSTADLPEGEAGTGLTNDKWSLPLLYELGFGLLPTSAGPEISGRTFAISRFFGLVPIHLVGCGLSLDRRAAGVRGAAIANPHGLVQEFLNRSPGHLWAIVSNGLRLRILRDSQALSRQSFLEFDLETMFSGEVYPDFVLFWLVAHASRFAPREPNRPGTCWLEVWSKLASEQGTRALGDLRGGVERALQILGEGFTSHPKNAALREALRHGRISPSDFHGQLLRAVYRLIFLFVAEDRKLEGQPLLHPHDDSEGGRQGRERFAAHYSTARLREMAGEIKGSRHGDLWRQFQTVVEALSGDERFAAARKELSLPALGSYLWNPASTPSINDSELTNFDFLETMRCLAFTRQGKALRPVDYKNLGAEELGGVYESLLGLTPQISADGARFTFAEFAGNERKTSGSYYTPDALVQCLLDSALDPVVNEAIEHKTGAQAEKAILDLKICDPAVGSGHFLVGAAHRLTRHLARIRALAQGDSEPSPFLYQHALRDVIRRCLYGVDLNPMAAELCRVSLWLEAFEPGKPLSFLDHHIRVGNSLLGATPELIAAGLPDGAFSPIEGDDKKACAALRKRNKQERGGLQRDMLHLMAAEPKAEYNSIVEQTRSIDQAPENTIDDIHRKSEQFRRLVVSPEYQHSQKIADAWCSAFVWNKHAGAPAEPITTDAIFNLEANANALTPDQHHEVERLSSQYQFFHWHLAFPEVIARGGFDCVLSNPPWERVKLQKEEWFAAQGRQDIVNAQNAVSREGMIRALKDKDPKLFEMYRDALRLADAESGFFRRSAAYPLSGTGDVNTYAIFTELSTRLVAPLGTVGLIIPTGLATDEQLRGFFANLIDEERLASLTGFENEDFFFPGIANVVRYCAIIILGPSRVNTTPRFAFYIRNDSQINEEARYFHLTRSQLVRLNPNTKTCPIFRTRFDAELTLRLYDKFPILRSSTANDNYWALSYLRMFDMANDSGLFLSGPIPNALPLYEAKLFWHYDHRFASYELKGVLKGKGGRGLPDMPLENHLDPHYSITPQYWVPREHVVERLRLSWTRKWLIAYRDISSAKLERTLVAAILPFSAVGHTAPIITLGIEQTRASHCFLAAFNSLVVDYIARQKVGGTHVSFFHIDQLPFPTPADFTDEDDGFIRPRVLELSFTSQDMKEFASDLGWSGNPFKWNSDRRFAIQCELDAYFAHLYGLTREEWLFLLDPHDIHGPSYPGESFRVLKEKEIEKYGEFRTKRMCLQVYDQLIHTRQSGPRYRSIIDPPPGSPEAAW